MNSFYNKILEYMTNNLPYTSPFESHADEDGLTIHECEGDSLECTGFVANLDHGTLFVRWISINNTTRGMGFGRQFITFIFDLCVQEKIEPFFQSCTPITKDIICRLMPKYPMYVSVAEDLREITQEDLTNMDITFRKGTMSMF